MLNGKVVVLDNENIFSGEDFTLMGYDSKFSSAKDVLEFILTNYDICNSLLEEFLKITPLVFSELLNSIEAELGIKIKKKKSFKYRYKKHYQEILNSFRGENKNAR